MIVAHEDRWSRDDTRSGADLERLQRAGVRFFVLDREQDLTDPTTASLLGHVRPDRGIPRSQPNEEGI